MISFYRVCAVALAGAGGAISVPFSFLDWQRWAILVPFSMAALFATECAERHAQSRSLRR